LETIKNRFVIALFRVNTERLLTIGLTRPCSAFFRAARRSETARCDLCNFRAMQTTYQWAYAAAAREVPRKREIVTPSARDSYSLESNRA
jgi:hypothetical protein